MQNPGMQRLVPVPSDLQPWLMAAVVVDAPEALAQSHFPAMVSSMLVVRLAGQVVCRSAPVPPAAWMSASTTATVYEHSGPVQAVGLVLQPEAAAALFASACGLVNTLRPLAELVGPGWADVEHAVRAAADDGARLQVLCDFIRQWVAPPSPCEARRQQALTLLQATSDNATGACQRLGLSQRQFERRFVAHWGMAPKQFQVIARLNSTLGHARQPGGGPGGGPGLLRPVAHGARCAQAGGPVAAGPGAGQPQPGHRTLAPAGGRAGAAGSYWYAFKNTSPFTLSLSKRRARLRQAQPERFLFIERKLVSAAGAGCVHAQTLSQVQRHHKREANAKAGCNAGPAPRAQAAVGRHPGRERHGGQVHVAGDAGGERIGKGVAPEDIGHHAATGQKVQGVEVPGDGQAQGGQQQKKNAQRLVVVHRCKRPSQN